MNALIGLGCGVMFGLGLIISGMANPAKVIGFLDITGVWDPTLAFVMGGALGVTTLAYRLILKRERPVFDTQFFIPTRRDLDAKLISGAALFGLGWGLIGLCPGPALVALGSLGPEALVFGFCLCVGMWLARTRPQKIDEFTHL